MKHSARYAARAGERIDTQIYVALMGLHMVTCRFEQERDSIVAFVDRRERMKLCGDGIQEGRADCHSGRGLRFNVEIDSATEHSRGLRA